jgi:hypothetical protein
MTPKRIAHVTPQSIGQVPTAQDLREKYISRQTAYHLLKFLELLDASTQKLPRLHSIDLELHTYDWADLFLTRIKATNMDGALWVKRKDVRIDTDHIFT